MLTEKCYDYAGRMNKTTERMAFATGTGPQISLKFQYDPQGRRIRKRVWNSANWTGSLLLDLKFLYDGWNLIGEVGSSGSLVRAYLWGPDISGSLQGAGGIGGLIAIKDATNGAAFAAFDGNGNVAALISALGGTNTARYEYGPFGETIRATGPMAKTSPLRFSTKYQDDELTTFGGLLDGDASASKCRQALNALGRVTHAWQDFYAHAIRRDGKGGREPGSPSRAEGWIAWSVGTTGSPQGRVNFWPSGYRLFGGGGEHPPFQEPIVRDGSEYWARFTAAQDYVELQFRTYLHDWLQHCKCYCSSM